MPDDLERQLEAFGATLESSTGEPIRTGAPVPAIAGSRPSRRWWSIAGAAASVLAVVVGLVALNGRDAEAPAAQPAVPTSTSTSVAVAAIDPEALREAPIEQLATGCNPADVVVSVEFIATGATVDEAFAVAYEAISEHTPPGLELLPAEGWREVSGEPITVRYLDRGRGIEGIVRIRPDGDEWRVTEVAQCLPGRVPSAVQTTTVAPPATSPEPPAEFVPDDPLALERDGWSLIQRTNAPFAAGLIPCEAAQGLADYEGVSEVHDILTPSDGTGLDLDVQVLDVGSIERGNRLAEVMTMIGRCAAEAQGIDGETGSLSSIRASWFRAGPDFALVTIVGEGPTAVVLEIEGVPFDDDLIGTLAHRADQFLRGEPISQQPATGNDGGSDADRPEVLRREMTIAEERRFTDDETGGLVCDERGRGEAFWDDGPIGPDDPTGRLPVDAFWEAIEQNVQEMGSEGGVPYPTNGWTELLQDDSHSLFVLEIDGEPQATIDVGGDPALGVWRVGQSAACQSLFIP